MLAAHADWSLHAGKRWVAIAQRDRGRWRLQAPEPVGDVGTFLSRLRARARGGPVALGLDMPIGVPRAYSQLLSATDFPAFLRSLSDRPAFFNICATLEELGPERPFYPARGARGMRRAAHAAALGLTDPLDLSRLCDRATLERPAGAPLFWTLGANQTGKAAVSGWRDMLLPALAREQDVRLWPFEGSLRELATPGAVAIAETYPAEALRHLCLKLSGSKRRQADRMALGPALRRVLEQLHASGDGMLERSIATGFGGDAAGEDRFDCLIGLLCVINVLAGNRPDGAPDDGWIRHWEGWVLGQTALPLSATAGKPVLRS
jgi:hypothetical protein